MKAMVMRVVLMIAGIRNTTAGSCIPQLTPVIVHALGYCGNNLRGINNTSASLLLVSVYRCVTNFQLLPALLSAHSILITMCHR